MERGRNTLDPTKYCVLVDENDHYQDEDSRWAAAAFDNPEQAVAKCQMMVDEDLALLHEPGMTADALFAAYRSFGDDPFVVAPAGAATIEFSAWKYAEVRCKELCTNLKEDPNQ